VHPIPVRVSRFAAGLAVLLCAVAPSVASAADRASWSHAQQREVVRAHVLPRLPGAGFAGARALTAGQLRGAVDALAARSGGAGVSVAGGRVTVAGFDRVLVRQLGLAGLARSVQAEARRAGLRPPARFGSEVVARQLGLRYNHPTGDDALELSPDESITRAEAAWSLARVLSFSGWEADYARQVLGRFKLPRYSGAQRRALSLAVSKIGMPYIWGGESDGRSSSFGPQAHGGYDCSGFVWRVFKLSGNPAGRKLGGRTADAMAKEFPRSQRLRFGAIRGGDLLFFGSRRYVSHVGIALSGEFMIHSSEQGVYVGPLWEDWRRSEFVWARRILP
jgi:cell wall-associated NlpC family hydrolase